MSARVGAVGAGGDGADGTDGDGADGDGKSLFRARRRLVCAESAMGAEGMRDSRGLHVSVCGVFNSKHLDLQLGGYGGNLRRIPLSIRVGFSFHIIIGLRLHMSEDWKANVLDRFVRLAAKYTH